MSARSLMKASAVIGITATMLIAVPPSYAASAADCAARADRAGGNGWNERFVCSWFGTIRLASSFPASQLSS